MNAAPQIKEFIPQVTSQNSSSLEQTKYSQPFYPSPQEFTPSNNFTTDAYVAQQYNELTF
jgi:hypothetical protein